GQFPEQPAIYRAETDFAMCGAPCSSPGVLEQPARFGRGEHRVDRQSGSAANHRLDTARGQLLTERPRAVALPHDCGPERSARDAVPEQNRLALIADRYGDYRAR